MRLKKILNGDYKDFGFCSFAGASFSMDFEQTKSHTILASETGSISYPFSVMVSTFPFSGFACRAHVSFVHHFQWSDEGEILSQLTNEFLCICVSNSVSLTTWPARTSIFLFDNIKADMSTTKENSLRERRRQKFISNA